MRKKRGGHIENLKPHQRLNMVFMYLISALLICGAEIFYTADAAPVDYLGPEGRWFFGDYKSKPHYRAFAAAPYFGPDTGALYGRSVGQSSVQAAINSALASCRTAGRGQVNSRFADCKLYAVGDKIVLGISQAKIQGIIRDYEEEHSIAKTRSLMGQKARNKLIELQKEGQHKDFKAFAYGSAAKRFGWSSGKNTLDEAISAAIQGCEKTGAKCELVAVGPYILINLNPAEVENRKKRYIDDVKNR